jgi:hypothetical protein
MPPISPRGFPNSELAILEPGREILRVIRARLVGDAKIGAEESGSQFGDLS